MLRLGALELEQAVLPTLSAHMDLQALPRPAPSAAESPSPGFTEAPVQSQAESLDDESQNSCSGCHRSSGGPSSPPPASPPGHLEHSRITCHACSIWGRGCSGNEHKTVLGCTGHCQASLSMSRFWTVWGWVLTCWLREEPRISFRSALSSMNEETDTGLRFRAARICSFGVRNKICL